MINLIILFVGRQVTGGPCGIESNSTENSGQSMTSAEMMIVLFGTGMSITVHQKFQQKILPDSTTPTSSHRERRPTGGPLGKDSSFLGDFS
jgi:hypothetical protein